MNAIGLGTTNQGNVQTQQKFKQSAFKSEEERIDFLKKYAGINFQNKSIEELKRDLAAQKERLEKEIGINSNKGQQLTSERRNEETSTTETASEILQQQEDKEYEESAKKANKKLDFLYRRLGKKLNPFIEATKDVRKLEPEQIKTIITEAKKININNRYLRGEFNNAINYLEVFYKNQEAQRKLQVKKTQPQSSTVKIVGNFPDETIKKIKKELATQKEKFYNEQVEKVNKDLKFLYTLSGERNIFSNDIKKIDTKELTPEQIKNIIYNANTLISLNRLFKYKIKDIIGRLTEFSGIQESLAKNEFTISSIANAEQTKTVLTKPQQVDKGPEKSTNKANQNDDVLSGFIDKESPDKTPDEIRQSLAKMKEQIYKETIKHMNEGLTLLYGFADNDIADDIKNQDAEKLTQEQISEIINKTNIIIAQNEPYKGQINGIIDRLKKFSEFQKEYLAKRTNL